MYLHLGEDVIIPLKQIIGIFDINACKKSVISKEFLEIAKSEKKQKEIGGRKKSSIVTNEKIYISQVSVTTLLKRKNDIFRETI